tara:strand:- start:430 stop:669 length:240 start_codon:yes stop_codon:yes gene_type:complete
MTKGIRSTEFFLTFITTLIGGTLASGLVSNSLALQLLGAASTLLASMGYCFGRSFVKAADSKGKVILAAAKLEEAVQGK